MAKSIHSAEHQALAALLRELREKAGFPQTEIARRLGTHQSFVSKYESGERRLDIVELRSIAGALGLTLRQLVDRYERRLR